MKVSKFRNFDYFENQYMRDKVNRKGSNKKFENPYIKAKKIRNDI
jgi:hypothetical protein